MQYVLYIWVYFFSVNTRNLCQQSSSISIYKAIKEVITEEI